MESIFQAAANAWGASLLMKCRVAVLLLLFCHAVSCSVGNRSRSGDERYWQDKIVQSEQTLQEKGISPGERGTAMIKMARAYSALEEKNTALRLWQDILSRADVDETSRARAQYRIALADEEAGRWEEAIAGYQKYSSLYYSLLEDQRDNFDQVSEHGAVLLFHAGELYEHRKLQPDKAVAVYQKAIRIATEEQSLNLIDLIEHLGDFYFRQKQYEKAIEQYETVSAYFQENESAMASPATRPEYKIIQSLMLAGRKEEARKRYDGLIEKWGKTNYQLDKDYVEKARVLMKE